MEIFIDTANIDEIKKYSKFGIIDGVTTNPALIAKEGKNFKDVLVEICDIVDGPISAEVVSTDTENMIREGRLINQLHKNIVVKLPSIPEGFEALNVLSSDGIKTNFTVVYTSNQALLAAKAGATFISPFVGRLDDIGADGMNLISEIVEIYSIFDYKTQVLAASIRGVQDVVDSAKFGAHVATIPPKILRDMYYHPLTDKGLDAFLSDWKKTGQSIL